MKLIKKMLAIMFAFMMVVGMGTKVNAEENESTTATTGTITIGNAVNGQSYSIYKVLELESYDKDNKLYSYKPASDWNSFFDSTIDDVTQKPKGAGSAYITIDSNGYATWIAGTTDADKATFAKLALEYAKNKPITPVTEEKKIENKTLEFTGLEFGYYLVDSSVGTLCGLDTTNPTVTINEKNGTPTVEKKVKEDSKDTFESSDTADIGQTVEFKTTITAQAGAQNYVLHDKMDAGLTFNNDIRITLNSNEVNNDSYSILLKSNSTETKSLDDCTFEIDFSETFCNSLKAGDQIIVSYSATLNENAVVGNAGNKNETWLKYGNSTETTHSYTTTYTFEIPVFKYTGENTPLAGAKFTLYSDKECKNPISLVKEADNNVYHRATTNESNNFTITKITEITTDNTGIFKITGLDADTYYLTETEAPKGYNKLASPIKVEINDDGTLKVDGESITQVNVENKTGTLLPSTGGMGTTVIYIVGALLVLISGVVLITKKRADLK